MNERIEQLIKQSYVERDSGDGTWFSKEKFAELIVKETLRVTGATPSMTETAKKHFGVE